jgi:hypothetical protein
MWGFLSKRIRDLWPVPALGLDAVYDQLAQQKIPNTGTPVGQAIHAAERGLDDQGYYRFQTYNVGQDRIVIPSLAREYLTSVQTAAWRVGSPEGVNGGYPQSLIGYHHFSNDPTKVADISPVGMPDFGPGYHGDCMTPQFYMRPGIKVPVSQGGRQI